MEAVLADSPALAPIVGLGRDDPPYTAPRVLEVAGIARDEVDMEVRHGLPSCRAIVDSDVEAVRPEINLGCGLGHIKHGQHSKPLFGSHLKERADVPPRDDQAVARGDWIAIANPEGTLVLASDAL
jgi:hypothetical protein